MADLPLFQQIKLPAPVVSDFDLSFANHLTTDAGRITPILCKELIPRDKVKELGTELFIRCLPLTTPVMGRIKAYVHGFFVPNRIMWNKWERFISGWDGITISDQTDPVPPYMHNQSGSETIAEKSLADYLGIPARTYAQDSLLFTLFRFNAYQRIYDEWYRDQNLESSDYVELTSGLHSSISGSNYTLRYRAYRKDYFTSALPWPQRGDQVTFPLGISAPIKADVKYNGSNYIRLRSEGLKDQTMDSGSYVKNALGLEPGSSTTSTIGVLKTWGSKIDPDFTSSGKNVWFSSSANGNVANLYADLSSANALTVNEFRRTMALQRWLETNARGGSRYNETLYAHFGVQIPDYRINRSQYIGGASVQFNVDPVEQNSATVAGGTPQATLCGKASSYGYLDIASDFYPMEHGVLMLLLTIMPDATYFQGVSRFLTKLDKFDYAWPEFANLGEQEIENYELYADGSTDATATGVFGYQSRYAEYKYSENELHGDLLKPGMQMWTTARKFSSSPTLGNTFIKVSSSGLSHIFADTSTSNDHFIVECYNHFKVERALPIFGTPELS